MNNSRSRHRRKVLSMVSLLCVFVISSAWGTVITWSLNPSGTKRAVGATNQTLFSSGHEITASGYTVGYPDTPLDVYFETSGIDSPRPGVIANPDHQLQRNAWPPTFIQLDLMSPLWERFTEGQVQVGNMRDAENFGLWGSAGEDDPGQQIGTLSTSSSNLSFINVADFSTNQYLSIRAVTGDVLPVAFRSILAPIPEMGALFPIIGIIVAITITQILRRRRIAQLRAASPNAD
jgi:hypothetical protein